MALTVTINQDEVSPSLMMYIVRSFEEGLTFGLKCEDSAIIFCIGNLTAYWIGKDGKEAQHKSRNIEDFKNVVKLQCISHKEFFLPNQYLNDPGINPKITSGKIRTISY
jgi:hypothetical protein